MTKSRVGFSIPPRQVSTAPWKSAASWPPTRSIFLMLVGAHSRNSSTTCSWSMLNHDVMIEIFRFLAQPLGETVSATSGGSVVPRGHILCAWQMVSKDLKTMVDVEAMEAKRDEQARKRAAKSGDASGESSMAKDSASYALMFDVFALCLTSHSIDVDWTGLCLAFHLQGCGAEAMPVASQLQWVALPNTAKGFKQFGLVSASLNNPQPSSTAAAELEIDVTFSAPTMKTLIIKRTAIQEGSTPNVEVEAAQQFLADDTLKGLAIEDISKYTSTNRLWCQHDDPAKPPVWVRGFHGSYSGSSYYTCAACGKDLVERTAVIYDDVDDVVTVLDKAWAKRVGYGK